MIQKTESVIIRRIVEITQLEEQKGKKLKRNEDSIGDFWDNIQQANICIIEVPEGEEGRKRQKTYLKK